MGPFSGTIWNRVRKNVIGKACKVVEREEISAKYLREQLGIASDVTTDSAFQTDVPIQYLEIYAHNDEVSTALNLMHKNKVVGMSLLDLRWMPKYGKRDDLQEIVDDSFTAFIEWLLARGYFLLLIPQTFGAHEPNAEMQLLQRVRELDPHRIFVPPDTPYAYVQQTLTSKLFAVVSMRYHLAVFATKGGVPALGIPSQHKMEGLFDKMKRLDCWCASINSTQTSLLRDSRTSRTTTVPLEKNLQAQVAN